MKNISENNRRRSVAVIVPVYNEEENLPECRRALSDIFSSLPDYDFNVLFVDDGSTDRSWDIIGTICSNDDRFRGIQLSRNFGSHAAIAAGFDIARADAYVVMACDLQDPPDRIPEFIDRWTSGAEVVFGNRRLSADGFPRGLINKIFYSLMNRYAVPPGTEFSTGSFFLVDEKAARVLRQMTERNRLTFTLLARIGFRQASVKYDRKPRIAGKSGWSGRARLKALFFALSGSRLPARIMFLAGIISFVVSGILALFRLWNVPYALVLSIVCFLFTIQFAFMGFIVLYLKRIHSEAAGMPLYIVRSSTGQKDNTQVIQIPRSDTECR